MTNLDASSEPLNKNIQRPLELLTEELEGPAKAHQFIEPFDADLAVEDQTRLKRIGHVGKRATQGIIMGLEGNLLTNDVPRYILGAGVLAATKNPLITTAIYTGATTLFEGSAALAAADVASSSKDGKVMRKINSAFNHGKLSTIFLPQGEKMSRAREAFTYLYLGTSVYVVTKQREDPNRTHQELRRSGLNATGVIAAANVAEGLVASEGIINFNDPKISVPAAIAFGGLLWAGRKVKHKLGRQGKEQPTVSKEDVVERRYDLNNREVRVLEKELADISREQYPEDGVFSIWVDSRSKYTNIARTYEAKYFPEVQDVPDEVEDKCLTMLVLDTRDGVDRIVHASNIMVGARIEDSLKDSNEEGNVESVEKTDMFVIDDLINSGNFTAKEFRDYYTDRGIDLSKSVSIETHFRIGDATKKFNSLSISDLAYLSIFQFVKRGGFEYGHGMAFATINRNVVYSLKKIKMDYELLMGRDDFDTPEHELGRTSLPVAIPYNKVNSDLFDSISSLDLPELKI
jgi:hypothetical protein